MYKRIYFAIILNLTKSNEHIEMLIPARFTICTVNK